MLVGNLYKILDAIYKLLDSINRLSETIFQQNMTFFIKCSMHFDMARCFPMVVGLVSHGGNSNLGYCVITHQFFRYSWMIFSRNH